MLLLWKKIIHAALIQILVLQEKRPGINKIIGIAVLSDFDGTLTPSNGLDILYKRFGAPSCKQVVERWDRGEISTMEELTTCFSTMAAHREEMEIPLMQITLDPAVPQLLKFCSDRDYEFAIVSDGLRWYIDLILKKNGIKGVEVYANEIDFTIDGFRFSFPWYDPVSALRGTSKLNIVRSYQEKGYKVVFIGDGLSDIEVLQTADVIYARDDLIKHARAKGIQAIEFSRISDLLLRWEPF